MQSWSQSINTQTEKNLSKIQQQQQQQLFICTNKERNRKLLQIDPEFFWKQQNDV